MGAWNWIFQRLAQEAHSLWDSRPQRPANGLNRLDVSHESNWRPLGYWEVDDLVKVMISSTGVIAMIACRGCGPLTKLLLNGCFEVFEAWRREKLDVTWQQRWYRIIISIQMQMRADKLTSIFVCKGCDNANSVMLRADCRDSDRLEADAIIAVAILCRLWQPSVMWGRVHGPHPPFLAVFFSLHNHPISVTYGDQSWTQNFDTVILT